MDARRPLDHPKTLVERKLVTDLSLSLSFLSNLSDVKTSDSKVGTLWGVVGVRVVDVIDLQSILTSKTFLFFPSRFIETEVKMSRTGHQYYVTLAMLNSTPRGMRC